MEADLTSKIRAAITKKLVDLGSYVDNELPEYIMVMVANKKSKESMESDLSLFLGKNTNNFTTWLHGMLNKFEVGVSCEFSNGSDSNPDAKAVNDSNMLSDEVITTSVEEEDILALDAQVQDDDILSKELRDDTSSMNHGEKHHHESGRTTTEETESKMKGIKDKATKQKNTVSKSSSQKAKPLCRSSVKRVAEEMLEDEYDPLNPSVKSVASIVHLNERKSSVPPALQANKLLLLKAVDDANKSIVGKQNVNEIYRPTPIKILKRPSTENSSRKNRDLHPVNLPAHNLNELRPKKRFASEVLVNQSTSHKLRPNLLQINTQPETERYSPKPVTRNVQLSSMFDVDNEDAVMADLCSGDEVNTNSPPEISPHFVVTLGGLDDDALKGKWTDAFSESSDIENTYTKSSENVDAPVQINEKQTDRCRFWPTCKNGDSCSYYHPTIPCKTFPNCSFGDKCHFIHPNCKFDSLCSRKDCPYTHLNRREYANSKIASNFQSVSIRAKSHSQPVAYRTTVCKFFPNCNSYNCVYLHPKKCRFGAKCKSTKCPFVHPSYPSRSQLTWKSGSSI